MYSDGFETKQARNEAIRNANRIKANILKLVRTFRREDMQIKMQRDFRDIRPQNSEIERFNQSFEKVKQLWFTKLGTSLEDHIRMQDQVELSSKRVADLKVQLATKVETLEKFKKSSEEHKKSARDETEKLKKDKSELKQAKYTAENQLSTRGANIKEDRQKTHEQRMAELSARLRDLVGQHTITKGDNSTKEKALLTQFENANNKYKEALSQYDTDMQEKNKDRNETKAELDDQNYQLAQIREQWQERVEEKRKREVLEKIMAEKKKKQAQEMNTLNSAAMFLQAHYRGMMARKDMEKARKGKKGKRRKKWV